MKWFTPVVVLIFANVPLLTTCTGAGEGDGEGEGEGEGDGEGEAAQDSVEELCARFDECTGFSAGECEVQFRNLIINYRNRGGEACTAAADGYEDGFTCVTQQDCVVIAGGVFAWQEVCPEIAAAREDEDTCNGVVAEGEGEGELPCLAAEVFSIVDQPEDLAVRVASVAGVFDAERSPACGDFFGPDSASARLIIVVEGDASLLQGGMSGFDGSSATQLQEFVVVDDTTVEAVACAADTSRPEVAVQLFFSDILVTNAACGAVAPAG